MLEKGDKEKLKKEIMGNFLVFDDDGLFIEEFATYAFSHCQFLLI